MDKEDVVDVIKKILISISYFIFACVTFGSLIYFFSSINIIIELNTYIDFIYSFLILGSLTVLFFGSFFLIMIVIPFIIWDKLW